MTGIRSSSQTQGDALARELAQPLHRVDLSAVVSKYIGQTEKNLRAVFDDAEDSDAILLFEEGDSLFGQRSEGDSGIGYLLGRIHGRAAISILVVDSEETAKRLSARFDYVIDLESGDDPD